jgi:hypothetical protein
MAGRKMRRNNIIGYLSLKDKIFTAKVSNCGP